MNLVIAQRTVSDRKRWLIGWSIGVAAFVVVNLAFYPSFRDQADELNKMFENLPEGLRSLIGLGNDLDPFSPVGYLSSQVYALGLPLLMLVASIGLGAALAGDEEHGLLEMTLAAPLTRRRLILERSLAHFSLLAILSLVAWIAVVFSVSAVDLSVGISAVTWPTVAMMVLVVAVGQVTLAIGAVTGRRSIAISIGSVVAISSYVVTSLADAGIGFFDTIRPMSLFTHYDAAKQLQSGRPTTGILVLAAVAAVGTLVAIVGFNRRDVRT